LKLKKRHSRLAARDVLPGYREAVQAMRFLRRGLPAQPRVGIVLGSGLGDVVTGLEKLTSIPYQSIPHFPQPTVEGHAGTLHLGFWGGVPTAVLEGRVHLYEGYSTAEVVFPVRVLADIGVRTLVLTCAAGGIARRATPGSFMIFSDHLNLLGQNPLVGLQNSRWGAGFVDMGEAYDAELRRLALRVARKARIKCFAGSYAAVLGPSFETPAEIRALQRLGAEAVGMSSVLEVIAARQMGLRLLAIATITNRAAGLARHPLSHVEVLKIGKRAAQELKRLLDHIIPVLENCHPPRAQTP
jgi:purine-nucleoside phosphorylase